MSKQRQRVLITAGAAGIGRAIAEKFLEAGARVHVCDVSQDAIETITRELPEISATIADVADQRQVERLFKIVEEVHGGLDVLVNNAGVGGERAPLEEVTDEDWTRTIDVNLTGAFRVTRSAAPVLKAAGGGAIINISTASVRTGLPYRTPYVASKQGLMGLTSNLARELGQFNIRCNAILPGLVDNPRGRALVTRLAAASGRTEAEVEADWLRFVSMRCWIDPAEVGELAVFLASPGARHITGQFIGVCGGAEWEE